MIAVADYGASNVGSVLRALRAVGADAVLSADPEVVRRADQIVLPGVGHFAPAMRALVERGLADAITDSVARGKPMLGLCLGLQLFLETSEEAPGVRGLGLLPGSAVRFRTSLPVPHVGWAKVDLTAAGRAHPVLAAAFESDATFFYHVHSYHPDRLESGLALANAEYGETFATIAGAENVIGVQFHPEKSQARGLALLSAFARWQP